MIETEIGLILPDNFEKLNGETQELLVKYLKSLNEIDRIAYNIGKRHLGTSFNVIKSNGFNDWLKEHK